MCMFMGHLYHLVRIISFQSCVLLKSDNLCVNFMDLCPHSFIDFSSSFQLVVNLKSLELVGLPEENLLGGGDGA